MSRSLTAQDRSALIRLSSSLPSGSPERRALLAALKNGVRETTISFDLDLPRAVNRGDEVADLLDNGVRPVRAIVVDPDDGYGLPVVQVTFLDEEHARKWMKRKRMDVDDIEFYLSRGIVRA